MAIMDAGSGIRKLGKEIKQHSNLNKDLYLIFTHFHWDHIQGFPFFNPAYIPGYKINILAMGKDRPFKDLKELFSMQMQEAYFPVSLEEMGSRIEFIMPGKEVELFWNTLVTFQKHDHPGIAYSYRIDWMGKSFVFATDIEHKDHINQDIVRLSRGVDLLIHDGQYTEEELKHRKGWGHSSYDQAIEVARQAACQQLVITHHDPDHNDEFLSKMEKYCQEQLPNCQLAREGLEIVL